jgi:rhodanese-related sulfurtransferase
MEKFSARSRRYSKLSTICSQIQYSPMFTRRLLTLAPVVARRSGSGVAGATRLTFRFSPVVVIGGGIVTATLLTWNSVQSIAYNDGANKDPNYERARQQARTNFAKFPDVPTISAEEFAKLDLYNAIIVDVRTDAETSVSMIKNAITKKEFEERYMKNGVLQIDPKTPVFVYCTFGIRSARYCQELIKLGANCRNMEGIVVMTHFQDVLYQKGMPTRKVHTFGPQWALASSGYEAVN